MVTYRELASSLRKLDLDPSRPVIAHASLSAFGEVQGGADSLLGALLSTVKTLVMPTFTYKTMVTPEVGPPDNALTYGGGRDLNRMAEFYFPKMPADRLMGILPETLRRHPQAVRSLHPILSFAGIGAADALAAQSLAEPLAPIRVLAEAGGWVLLLGVTHIVNTSIHYAERLAGRRQFVRWALTPSGVVECPGFPGCSDGFDALAPQLERYTRRVMIGEALVLALPLTELITVGSAAIQADPLALLCDHSYCERCHTVRRLAENHRSG
jgi:aminoglycoside 3-N-acetyltransferase